MEWPKRVQFALRTVRGVDCAHVDFCNHSVTVVCEPECDREALREVLTRRGYGATIL